MADRAEQGGGVATPVPAYQITMRAKNGGIVTGSGADWFGPLNPMAPTAPPDVAGRILDFPVGYNLGVTPRAYEVVGFEQMRALADAYDMMRIVIETRKDQMTRLPWNIKKKGSGVGSKGRQAEKDATIKKIEEFLACPDRVNPFSVWLRMLLEDLFVIDAPSIYVRRTKGGELYALEVMDGGTLKRVIDDWGRTPDPPLPAFQQVLKGLPAINYTTNDVIYAPRNRRSHKIYGYSPVEQVIMTVNIGLRRQVWQLQYYTEGNVPEAIVGVPETWTPEQVAAFQAHWDSLMEGNTAQRRHMKFVPGGVAKTYVQTKDPELMNLFDEWLARVVCFAFSVPATPFVRMMNRATGEIAETTAIKEGMYPIMQWVKNLLDGILVRFFGAADYEFVWERDAEPDLGKLTEVLDKQLKAGALTLDEYRDEMGRDPYPDGIGEKPMIYGAGEPVLLEDVGLPPDPDPLGLGSPMMGHNGGPPLDDQGKPKVGPDGKPLPPKPGQPPLGAKEDPKKTPPAEEGDEGEVAEKGAAPFDLEKAARPRSFKPVPRNTRKMKQATRLLERELRKAFRTLAKKTTAQIRTLIDQRQLGKGAAAADALDALQRQLEQDRVRAEAEAIADEIDFEDFQVLIQPTEKALKMVAEDAGAKALQQVKFGATDQQMMNQVQREAQDYARARAAEMVGMRVTEDGGLVENPNARWAITDGTRDKVRTAIMSALEEGDEPFDLQQAIENAGFDPQRAQTIARTELARAHVEGSLAGYKEAAGDGVKMKKAWITAEDHKVDPTICAVNAKQGPIPLDEKFQSGDDGPPGHPNCRCDLLPVLDEGSDDDES